MLNYNRRDHIKTPDEWSRFRAPRRRSRPAEAGGMDGHRRLESVRAWRAGLFDQEALAAITAKMRAVLEVAGGAARRGLLLPSRAGRRLRLPQAGSRGWCCGPPGNLHWTSRVPTWWATRRVTSSAAGPWGMRTVLVETGLARGAAGPGAGAGRSLRARLERALWHGSCSRKISSPDEESRSDPRFRPGRAGIIGNPTDGYGGTVVSTSLAQRAYRAARLLPTRRC